MAEQNYIVICQTKKQADSLHERLCEHLLDTKAYFRGIKKNWIVKLTLPNSIVSIRFVSEQSPHTQDVLRGFHGQTVSGQNVERWLDVHENYKTIKHLKR